VSRQRDLVLAAVRQGVSNPLAIAGWTSVPISRVHTELGRLADAKLIRREGALNWIPMPEPVPIKAAARVVRLMTT
jgi:hypothetical protein